MDNSPFTKRVEACSLNKLANVSRAKKAQPALARVVHILEQTVATVKASSASKNQTLGKADWIAGNVEQLRGLHLLERELADVLAGNDAAARDAFVRGEVLLTAGNKIVNRGDRLLGLSTRY